MSRIKPLYDNIRLNAVIVSDTHIDEKHPMPFLPKVRLNRALRDSQRSKSPVDVFLTVGDTTSRGSRANWELSVDCFSKYTPAKKIIFTVGNHDCWNDDGFDVAISEYYAYFEKICGDKINRPYYSYVINGYHFVFLGNDSDAGCEANISDEQFDWFRDEMKKAGNSGKPIFVFCHQSLNGKHGLPRTWSEKEDPNAKPDEGGIGARSDEIEAEMKEYKDVFYFSGHSHMGVAGEEKQKTEGYSSIEVDEGLTLVNFPSLACGNHHGDLNTFDIGMVLEAYDDKVVLRFRNHFRKCDVTSVSLQNGKPVFIHNL